LIALRSVTTGGMLLQSVAAVNLAGQQPERGPEDPFQARFRAY
jgi:hypothetical protein